MALAGNTCKIILPLNNSCISICRLKYLKLMRGAVLVQSAWAEESGELLYLEIGLKWAATAKMEN